MKQLSALLCLCALCLSGCAPKQEPLPPEEFFQPEIYEPAPMPQISTIPIEETAQPVDLLALSAPPNLHVECGGAEVHVMECGFNWVTENGILCADALHPLQTQEHLTVLKTTEEAAVLRFDYAPDEKHVLAWDENCTPDCDGIGVSVPVSGGVIELLPGGYRYVVTASWGDGETAGGTATYVFHIVKTE